MSDLEKIAPLAERLLKDVARLNRDIIRLHGRLEPFEGEPTIPDPVPTMFPLQTVPSVLNALHAAAQAVLTCEYHMSKVRGVIESIEADAVARAEMKPFIKQRDGG